MAAAFDEKTRSTVAKIPLCTVRGGPRDGDAWVQRLKEEYKSLISVRHHPSFSVHG
jgi:ufm1-conjugating enzyme 1